MARIKIVERSLCLACKNGCQLLRNRPSVCLITCIGYHWRQHHQLEYFLWLGEPLRIVQTNHLRACLGCGGSSRDDYGMGYLAGEDGKAYIVILAAGEDLKLEGESLSSPETVVIISGRQNQLFEKYATDHPRREQALSAWNFLANIYSLDPLFARHENPKKAIEAEKHRIREEDRMFLAGLNPDTYLSWYLPLRRLVSSVSTIAKYRTEEIPASIEAFREMDYTDARLYKSGLLNETSCTINNDLASQLKSYRAMKIGNTAPDFAFSGDYLAPGYETGKSPLKLSELHKHIKYSPHPHFIY